MTWCERSLRRSRGRRSEPRIGRRRVTVLGDAVGGAAGRLVSVPLAARPAGIPGLPGCGLTQGAVVDDRDRAVQVGAAMIVPGAVRVSIAHVGERAIGG